MGITFRSLVTISIYWRDVFTHKFNDLCVDWHLTFQNLPWICNFPNQDAKESPHASIVIDFDEELHGFEVGTMES